MTNAPDPDRARVRDAARSVGVWVGVCSAVVLASGIAILVTIILATSRPDGTPGGDDGSHPSHAGGPPDGDRLIVDVDHVLPWVIVLGLVGIVLLALIGWLAARRAVRPLGEALRMQRDFVGDASHELRTPLTALHSRVQIIQRRHERGQPIEEALGALRGDADAMNDVLSDLLLAASAAVDPHARATVGDAVTAAVDLAQPLAADADVVLDAAQGSAADVLVRLPPTSLRRLLVALIDNAVQHAPAGSTVHVRSERREGVVILRVSDEGSGIVGIAPERVFERFARASGESGRRRGFGIGLALVRDLARRAGGDVDVESTGPSGTTFRVRLPLG